jgi:hypothetical protein
VALITDGVSDPGRDDPPNVALHGMSADGTDLIFTSFAKLAPDAVDGTMHLYDARVGGGFPLAAPVACAGESCQGELSRPSSLREVASFAVGGRGDRRRLIVRVLRVSVSEGMIVLRVRAPGAGVVRVSGRRVRAARRGVLRAGAVVVRVRLTPAALRRLRGGHRLRVGLRVVFVSDGGGSSSVRVRVPVRAGVRRGR